LKKIFLYTFLCFSLKLNAQQINAAFNSSFKKFLAGNSLKHASVSLYVINNTTGKALTNFNTEVGLAPASCQKVITASTAFELLHHDYVYKTSLGYTGKIINGVLNGNLIVKGSGDPTLGSWRYNKTTEESIISEFKYSLSRYGIN
jgi:serine-type D-Ala-D-Ala carboxypeptidase/endopeptidase (penicillin-binding protein 4)